MAEVAEIKLFGKWTYEDVEVRTRACVTRSRTSRGIFLPAFFLGFTSHRDTMAHLRALPTSP